ncbi:MAG: Gfo/Idh/MocA family protein [Planctomycetaceae bacterium]
MSAKPPFGLLLIGGGETHQENYARSFAADPRCRIVGLVDEADVPERRRQLNQALATALGCPHLPDMEEALRREDVDLVSVCVESERIGRVATIAARAGKHVYVDKPLAATVDEAREFVAAVEEAGVLSQMFSMVRTPMGSRSRRAVESGRLGTLIGLHADLFFAKGPAGVADLTHPRIEPDEPQPFTKVDSKRELFTVGLYPIVLFQWLTGLRVAEVFATTSNYFFAEHQQNGVEDFACVSLRLENGVDATITCGRTGWASHPSSGVHQVRLVGTRGTELIDAFRPRLETYADTPPWMPPMPFAGDPMGFWSSTQAAMGLQPKKAWKSIEPAQPSNTSAFLDCIEAGRESDVPAAVGAHAVEVILASYRSAATGQPVAVLS